MKLHLEWVNKILHADPKLRKTWELRPSRRVELGVIDLYAVGHGCIYGSVVVGGCIKLNQGLLDSNKDKHHCSKGDLTALGYVASKLYAWVLHSPNRYAHPVMHSATGQSWGKRRLV